MFCARCGQQIPEALGLCPVCGYQVNAPVSPAPAASVAQPMAAAPAGEQLPPPPPMAYAAPVHHGIGGWLLVFCIGFTILWPLWQLSQYALYHFAFRGPLGWLGPFRLIFGIVVGAMLWTGKPVAMQLLRIYFVLAGALTLWGLFNWTRIVLQYHANVLSNRTFIFGFGPSVVFLVSGLLYFSTSERVRAAYGSKLV
jgi:hypothetical protein